MIKHAYIIVLGLLLSGCSTSISEQDYDRYIGTWNVRYLPPGEEGLQYAMDNKPLPPSSEPEIGAFGDKVEISRARALIIVGDHKAEVKTGTNEEVSYSYATGKEQSEFGVEMFILSPAPDGSLYGVWSRVFWGINGELPPMVTTERFVLEKQKGEPAAPPYDAPRRVDGEP